MKLQGILVTFAGICKRRHGALHSVAVAERLLDTSILLGGIFSSSYLESYLISYFYGVGVLINVLSELTPGSVCSRPRRQHARVSNLLGKLARIGNV